MSNGLILSSDSLFSKWGFNDGDLPDFVTDALTAATTGSSWTAPYRDWLEAWQPVLAALVRERLVPACPPNLVLERWSIPQMHNPCRAEGWYAVSYEDAPLPFPTVTVEVPMAEVVALVLASASGTGEQGSSDAPS